MIEWLTPGVIYSLLKDIMRALRGRRRRLSPAQILEIRQKWKPQFEEEVWKTHSQDLSKDVIIRDVKRLNNYPNTDEKAKGISPWFRVGLMGTYHKGVLIGLSWGSLTQLDDGKSWRHTNYKSGEHGDLKTILIGYIPFENIVDVDWHGDEYYYYPHIFCYFDARRNEPYERLAYCVERCNPGGRPFYTEVAPYDEVRKLSKKHGVPYFG